MRKLVKREMYLIGVAIVLIGYFILDYDWGTPQTSETSDVRTTEISRQEKSTLQTYHIPENIPTVIWKNGWGSDPFFYSENNTTENEFTPKRQAGQRITSLQLTGISWLGHSGFAIINGTIVKPGDKIGGYVVEKIAEKYVTLKQGNKTERLTINE